MYRYKKRLPKAGSQTYAVQPPGLAASSWSQPQMNDSGAMTSSILLRRLRDEVTAGLEGAERPPPLQVVTQLAATY